MIKTFIFVGDAGFALRLGAALGAELTWQGQFVALVGTKIPVYVQLPVWELPAKVTSKNVAQALQAQGVTRVVSLAHPLACQAAAQANIPFVYIEPENHKDGLLTKTKKALLAKARRVIVMENSPQEAPNRIYPKDTIWLKNPALWVEHANFPKPACFKKDNNIVAVGTFDKLGGFKTLLNAWAQLAPLHSSWHLTLVENGKPSAALKKFITQHQLEGNTAVVGPETDLYVLLRSADIYVNPGSTPTGLEVLLDAMASKLPVITTEGHGEFVQSGINGLVVPAEDEAQLNGALDRLMVDWGYRVSLALHASQLRETYCFADFANQVFHD